MNLVPYTLTALSRQDIPDTPTDRNIVTGAIVTAVDANGATVTMFDDAAGSNGSTAKQTGSNGQVTVYVPAGEYTFSVNGNQFKVVVGAVGAFVDADALAATDSTVSVGGVEAGVVAKRSLGAVQQVTHLKALPTTGLIDNQQYSVAGFYADTNLGGGTFVYDENRSWSDHNGGSIYAVGALNAWDGTYADLATLLNFTGSGSGCFVKSTYNNEISLSEFGALNNTDKTLSLNSAIQVATDGAVIIDDTLNGTLSGTITITNRDIDLRLGKLVQTFAGRIIDYDAGLDFIRSVTSINATTRQIFMDVTGLSVGDVIKLVSDDRLAGTRPAVGTTSSRFGQYVTVSALSADHFVASEPIRYAYATNIRAAKLSGKGLKLKAEKLEYSQNISGSFTAVALKNGVRDEVNVVFGYLPFIGVSIFGGFKPRIKRAHFLKNPLSSPNGHGVSDWSCYGIVCSDLSSESCRHLFTTNQNPIEENSAEIWAYGPSYGGIVYASTGSGEHSTWMDTHHGCEDFAFYGGNYVGQSGAVAVRGRRITWYGAQISGAENGIFAYSESSLDPSDYSEDIVFVSPVVRNISNQPIRAQRVRRMLVDNPVIHGKGFNIGSFITADIVIRNLTAYLEGSVDTNQSMFLSQEGCEVKLAGKTSITITNHTGLTPRFFSDAGSLGSNYTVDELIVENLGSQFTPRIANNTASTEMTAKVNITLNGVNEWNPIESGSILTDSSFIDLVGDVVARTNRRRSATVSASTIILSGFYTGAKNFLFDGNASDGEATVTGIENGRFDGQILVCRNAGVNAWTIPNSGNTFNIGSTNVTLTTRQTASYIWNAIDSRWIQFS